MSVTLIPRQWQKAAHQEWSRQMRGVVRVVTGGGKTVFAHLCMSTFHRRHPSGRVFIIVPTRALLDQWVLSLTDEAGESPNDIACYSGDEKADRPRRFNVVVINSARSLTEQLVGSAEAMLVVDECHRAGSSKNALAMRGKFVATLGLSATPERDHDDGFERLIAPTLGPIVFSYGYADAARDGVIANFVLSNVRVDFLHAEEANYARLTQRIAAETRRINAGKGSEKKLEFLLRRRAGVVGTARMRVPVAAKLAEQHRGQRTIVFHERVADATKIRDILHARGQSVTLYHTKVAPAVRRDNLRLFRRGVFDALVCCRALDEGINVPETAVAIIASATASERQRIQRLGRVLRPARGKSLATVFTIYVTDVEERRLVREAEGLQGTCEVRWATAR